VRELADVMAARGLIKAGYNYLNIDDGWACNRSADGTIVPCPHKFPSGMKALADYVHGKGLRFGIYTTWGTGTCAGFVGSYGHEKQDADTYAAWGVDFLKQDSCGGNPPNSMWSRYAKMRDALNATGRPIHFSITQQFFNSTAAKVRDTGAAQANETIDTPHPSMQCYPGAFAPIVWKRLGYDISTLANQWLVEYCNNGPRFGQTLASGGSLLSQLDSQQDLTLPELGGPGGWNDMDLLQVCNPGMTVTESRSEFSLWSVLASPIILSNDLRHMDADCEAILLNTEVIAVSQDTAGAPGKLAWQSSHSIQDDLQQIFVRPLAHGSSHAAVLFNRADSPRTITLTWDMLQPDHLMEKKAIKASCTVRDLWAHRSLGSLFNFTATVDAHAVAMVVVTCDAGRLEIPISI